MNINALKSFDWRVLKKFASPRAFDDLNTFLEKMPHNVGQTMLIVAGCIWAFAIVAGLFTTVQIQEMTRLRSELQEANALQPIVPVIRDVPVDRASVEDFVKRTKDVYQGLEITSSGSIVVITANATEKYGQFREAVGHVQNGGSGWRVSIEGLCVGRECGRNPLTASLKINKVSVDKPEF